VHNLFATAGVFQFWGESGIMGDSLFYKEIRP
jgi:hypothetical protein